MPSAPQACELPPPTLPTIAAAGVGRHTARHLLARIRTTPPLAGGDLLTLYWGNRFAAAHTLTADELDGHVDLPVPMQLLQGGEQRVHYCVLTPGQRARRSGATRVAVKLDCPGYGSGLAAPEVSAALLAEGVRLGSAVRVRIAPYRHMAAGDVITLCWGDLRLDLPPLNEAACQRAVWAWVPRELILEAGPDPRLELSYCVLDRVGNASGWSPVTHLRVL